MYSSGVRRLVGRGGGGGGEIISYFTSKGQLKCVAL